jgi:hypothetical protein
MWDIYPVEERGIRPERKWMYATGFPSCVPLPERRGKEREEMIMGWTHRAEAGAVMQRITAACLRQTGVQNVYKHNGSKYMWEVNPVSHKDGSITGSIHKYLSSGAVLRAGSFKISGDGKKVTGIGLAGLAGASVAKAVKKGRFTLQKFKYSGFQAGTGRRGETIYVDMGDRHPDPLKKLTWGFDSSGSMVHGDFNGFFEKVGKPQVFEFEQTGSYAAEEKRVKHAAIIRAVKRGW